MNICSSKDNIKTEKKCHKLRIISNTQLTRESAEAIQNTNNKKTQWNQKQVFKEYSRPLWMTGIFFRFFLFITMFYSLGFCCMFLYRYQT